MRDAFGFLLVKISAYHIYLSLEPCRNLKALNTARSLSLLFFFIAVLVIIFLIPFVATHGTSNDGSLI